MAITAGSVCTGAAVLLNDSAQKYFTFAILLPYLNKALQKLDDAFVENGVPRQKKTYSETVATGATALSAAPTDMYVPKSMFERSPSEPDDSYYIPMINKAWPPNSVAQQTLKYWTWNGDVISFVGATTDRKVKLEYQAIIGVVANANDAISIIGAQSYLESKTAAIAAAIHGNPSRAQVLDNDAMSDLLKVVNIAVKRMQANPVRRRTGYNTLRQDR